MPTIACLSPYSAELVRKLAGADDATVLLAPDPPAPDAVREIVVDADIVISDSRHKHRLDRTTLSGMRHCQLIVQPAVGFDVVDHLAAAELGIPVANAAGFNSNAVADWVIMGMLNVLADGAGRDRYLREGGWRRTAPMTRRELGSMTVGIIGMGNIGQAVHRRLRGFGSRVCYTDVIPREIPEAEQLSLEELLERSDLITIHVPLDSDTRGLIGADQFARLRKGAILVNASRGPAVDERALIEALRSGHLAGAALDVFENEPLEADSPLRSMDNVFLSPHAAGGTLEAAERSLEVIGENIRQVLAGGQPFNVVNNVLGNGAAK